MELQIGKKLQHARKRSGLTQEQAAERLGGSRQTISNWENERSYPDIISVIRMSDLYGVSLDDLLKGEGPMSDYLDYLKESTDTVRSNRRRTKLLLILVYLAIWAFALIVFWCFMSPSDAMGFSFMFLWVLLPVSIFVISLLVGWNSCWGRWDWLTAPVMGISYMLAEYATFSTANMVYNQFSSINPPEWGMLAAGAVISLIALGVGRLLRRRKRTPQTGDNP